MKIQQTHTPITRQGIMLWTLLGRETVPPQGAVKAGAQRVDWSRSPGAYRWLGNCIGLCWGKPCLLYTMCTLGSKGMLLVSFGNRWCFQLGLALWTMERIQGTAGRLIWHVIENHHTTAVQVSNCCSFINSDYLHLCCIYFQMHQSHKNTIATMVIISASVIAAIL